MSTAPPAPAATSAAWAATGARALPRVVLVDDDAAIRRLVALVLEDEPLELLSCSSVAQARQALRAGPVQLLLTDLMMPGETGHDLLQQLHMGADLPLPARVAVFSAGLDASTQAQLADLGVWRQLAKPVSVQALLAAVHEALSDQTAPALKPAAAAAGAASGAASGAGVAAQQLAIDQHFGGDTRLFQAYRQSCLSLFADDWRDGDEALARGNVAALRRLGHSLKSVLRSLGETKAADAAQTLDSVAQAHADLPPGDGPVLALAAAWACARQHLVRLAEEGSGSK